MDEDFGDTFKLRKTRSPTNRRLPSQSKASDEGRLTNETTVPRDPAFVFFITGQDHASHYPSSSNIRVVAHLRNTLWRTQYVVNPCGTFTGFPGSVGIAVDETVHPAFVKLAVALQGVEHGETIFVGDAVDFALHVVPVLGETIAKIGQASHDEPAQFLGLGLAN